MQRSVVLVTILILMPCAELNSQTIRREGTIALPPGASVSTQFLPRSTTICRLGDRIAAILSDKTVRVWELPSGKLAKTLDMAQPARTVELSNDCRLLAIADVSGAVSVWNTGSWHVQRKFSSALPVSILAISPDNHLVVGAGHFDDQVWDLTTGQHLTTVRPAFGNSMAMSFSPDSTLLATADSDTAIRVYDARTGALRSSVTELLLEPLALAFSADGGYLLAGGADRTMSVADPVTGKIRRALAKQPGVLSGLVISADGKRAGALYYPPDRFDHLAVALVWDLDTDSVRARFDEQSDPLLPAAAFVGDRLLLTTAHTNELIVWSLQ
jgi:WD40 repeat protein